MMRNFALFIFLVVLTVRLNSQNIAENGLVSWMTFKEAQEKNKTLTKPFIVDIYTDWCGWCKHMMKTTYANPNLAAYINQNFYPVKFDAETKDTIEFNGQVYKPTSMQPRTPHELAIKFLGQKLSYPSTIFITNKFEFNMLAQGYLEDKKLEPMLVFMVENAWQTTVFDDFNKHFTNTFYDTVFPKKAVRIYSLAEVEKLQKKKPRKVLVSISAPFCHTGNVMNKTTFVDTSVAAIVNKYFYLVNFDATSTDTVYLKNEKHFNTMVNNFPMHTLALKLTANRFSFPSLSVLDSDMNVIDVLNFYQGPERMKHILLYIGQDIYKTKSFNDFMQDYMRKPAQ
jgi:thioredoxin-related protein